jgi:hypothetical protein
MVERDWEAERMSVDAGSAKGWQESKALKSFGFIGIIAAVVGLFVFLSTLDPPPDLPKDAVHKFRFNTEGALVGLAADATLGDPEIAPTGGLAFDKKAVEGRVNQRCMSCHSAPGLDPTGHACQALGKCVPPLHPPKDTCIKCHRH